jgi:hypothetical protein
MCDRFSRYLRMHKKSYETVHVDCDKYFGIESEVCHTKGEAVRLRWRCMHAKIADWSI